MKRFAFIVVTVTAVILALTAADGFLSRSFVTRVQRIKVGDSREQVVATLGRAAKVFTPPQKIPTGMYLGVRVETWAYGKLFDWQNCFYPKFPYFWPFNVRLFGPDADDVCIEFDSNGTVSRVSIPTK